MKTLVKRRILWLIVIVVIWEVTYYTNQYAKQLFPSIEEIVTSIVRDFAAGNLWSQIGFSMLVILKGLTIGVVLAIILSLLDYFNGYFRDLLGTLISILHPLPGIALLPLVILWFGIGEGAILIIILHSVLWPMIITMKTAYQSIDHAYIEVGKNLGMSKWQLSRYVLLPMSLNHLIAGLKIGWSRAWRGLISAEMVFGAIGPFGGLGWFIFQKRVFMDTAGMYGGLVVIIVIGVLVEDILFGRLEAIIN